MLVHPRTDVALDSVLCQHLREPTGEGLFLLHRLTAFRNPILETALISLGDTASAVTKVFGLLDLIDEPAILRCIVGNLHPSEPTNTARNEPGTLERGIVVQGIFMLADHHRSRNALGHRSVTGLNGLLHNLLGVLLPDGLLPTLIQLFEKVMSLTHRQTLVPVVLLGGTIQSPKLTGSSGCGTVHSTYLLYFSRMADRIRPKPKPRTVTERMSITCSFLIFKSSIPQTPTNVNM